MRSLRTSPTGLLAITQASQAPSSQCATYRPEPPDWFEPPSPFIVSVIMHMVKTPEASFTPVATVEARWFLEGTVATNGGLLDWFKHAHLKRTCMEPQSLNWNERTDIYLLVPDSDDMGIKWREGQLQIKGRISAMGVFPFGAIHEGLVERWVKWSYSGLAPAYRSLFEKDTERLTVPVRKRRALRKIRVDKSSGAATEVGHTEAIERGLGFEFTEIEAAGKSLCSVAFEAFPDDAGIISPLFEVIGAYLEKYQEGRLSAADSYSYPAALTALLQ